MSTTPTHEELGSRLALAQAGDDEAMAWLVGRFSNYVFKVCMKMTGNRSADADDIAQVVWIKVFLGLRNGRLGQPELFKNTLALIARCSFVDWARREFGDPGTVVGSGRIRRREEHGGPLDGSLIDESIATEANGPLGKSMASELAGWIADAIGDLAPELRPLALAMYVDGLSQTDAARLVASRHPSNIIHWNWHARVIAHLRETIPEGFDPHTPKGASEE